MGSDGDRGRECQAGLIVWFQVRRSFSWLLFDEIYSKYVYIYFFLCYLKIQQSWSFYFFFNASFNFHRFLSGQIFHFFCGVKSWRKHSRHFNFLNVCLKREAEFSGVFKLVIYLNLFYILKEIVIWILNNIWIKQYLLFIILYIDHSLSILLGYQLMSHI